MTKDKREPLKLYVGKTQILETNDVKSLIQFLQDNPNINIQKDKQILIF